MVNLTHEIVKRGISMQVDELVILQHAVIAFALDPERIQIGQDYYISLSIQHTSKRNDAIRLINPIRYTSCINALMKHGFFEKKIHAEAAWYKASEVLQELCNMSFLEMPAEQPAKKKATTVTPKKTMEERKLLFVEEAKVQFDEWNTRATNVADRSSTSAYILSKDNLKQFIEYWTAPMQKKKDTMLWENEVTWAWQGRIRTAVISVFNRHKQ